jgi:hypothetical protein
MAQDNEYVQKLIAARDREVAHRRDIARTLAEKQNRGDSENIREAFIKIQGVIEAIERAVWHEKYIATQSPSRSRLSASEARRDGGGGSRRTLLSCQSCCCASSKALGGGPEKC